jgi:hypothetical protein
MTNKYKLTLIAVLWLLTLGTGRYEKLPAADHAAILMIVDNSGSMKTSDPNGLRFAGVHLFASLLDIADLLGLIVFSTQVEVATGVMLPAGQYQADTGAWENSAPHGYTDIKAALEKARAVIKSTSLENQKIEIILLTDGKPEISNPYPQYEQETLDLARSLNIPIMAIALTSAAQTPFLEQLADETNGAVIPADDASDLLGAYLQILGQIKDRTVIGGKASGKTATLEIEQALAPYINSATFVVAKPEGSKAQLLDPDGREMDWDESNDTRFSLITLENPAGGMYAFHLPGKGEMKVWAILRSRLRVQIVSPLSVHPAGKGMSIVVNLLEETTPGKFTKIIGEANFTALITSPDGGQTSLDRFYDDGTHGDVAANDGNYTRTFPDTTQTGGYLISVQGWKGTIPVGAESRVQVLPFPELVIDAPLGNLEMRGEAVELRAHLRGADASGKLRIVTMVSSPSGEIQELEMQGSDSYTAKFLPLETGEYQVVFETRDAEYRGVEYQARAEHSFKVTVIPFAKVAVNEINLPASCLSQLDEVLVTLMVNASNDGTLQLSASDGWEVNPGEIQVRKGGREIQLILRSMDELSAGIERVELIAEGAGKLEVQPENALQVEIEIPGLRERCRTPLRFGFGIFALTLASGAIMVRARKAERPLPISGTLRHWELGKSSAPVEIDLTAFGKNALLIGSGATCDVMIPHADLDSEHARIIAEKIPAGIEVLLNPIGEVRKGYSQQIAPFTLRHGETFRMGAHEFQYLSDRGE